ncbi:MAG: hypothetical protein ACRDHU_03950 [Actinomycetota bacterium]
MPPESPPDSFASAASRLALPAVVAFAVVVRVVVIVALLMQITGGREPKGYVTRFSEIATAPGRPYRDHPVEYPPMSLGVIELLGDEDPFAAGVRVLWFAAAADALVAISLLWGWGRRASAAYLGASVPILWSLYQTLDILPVVLASWGVALAWRHRERSGGALLAAAALAKLWPVVLVPGLAVWGRRRALAWCVGVLAAGTVLWVSWGGTGALSQVATQRQTPGWEVESTVGVLVWMVGDEEIEAVKDSPRVGVAPTWAKALLAGVTALGVAGLWIRAARGDAAREVGAPSLACVALLLFLAPIYSYPYVLWILPWMAIGWSEGRTTLAGLAFGVVLLTAVLYALLDVAPEWVLQLVLLLRNVATGAIPVAYVLGRAGQPVSWAASASGSVTGSLQVKRSQT